MKENDILGHSVKEPSPKLFPFISYKGKTNFTESLWCPQEAWQKAPKGRDIVPRGRDIVLVTTYGGLL